METCCFGKSNCNGNTLGISILQKMVLFLVKMEQLEIGTVDR